ncbi:uncharacterized protein LOC119095640 isoform X2 [Pollicipes pollicipes]|uniref:uncharacterized protein LOC119095640 isoform X2 n=1 Tax=Pollicipes pollicipes TaxID=41117 RepID=UPI0018850D56|nr:uncharacterized protein LOC119095640 isoform X2 [Pollicipes pollicipes]
MTHRWLLRGSVQKRDTEYAGHDGAETYNNYYQRAPARKRNSGPLGWVQNLFRRSSYDSYDSGSSGSAHSGYSAPSYQQQSYHPRPSKGGFSIGDVILPIILLCAGLGLGALAAAAFSAALSSSGRGLDSDEWEIDHSVWMDQLQKDFEDSWATE